MSGVDGLTTKLGDQILTALQTEGLPAALRELETLRQAADAPWKVSFLGVATDLIATRGPEGFAILKNLARTLHDGGVPDLNELSLREASEILAILQRQEADAKKEVQKFLNVLLESLVKVATILVAIVIKEI